MTLSQKGLYITVLYHYFEVLFLKIRLNKSLTDITTTNDNGNNKLMPSLLRVLSHSLLIHWDIFEHNLAKVRR